MYSETDYYKINENLLRVVGLWSTRHTRLKVCQVCLAYLIYVSALIIQLLVFFTSKCTLALSLRLLSTICPLLIGFIRYHNFNLHSSQAREILNMVKGDWEFMAENHYEDLHVLHAYGHISRMISMKLTVAAIIGLAGCLMTPIAPSILDIIMPLNETRIHRHLAISEYFVDQQTHYFPIFLHQLSATALCLFTMGSCELFMTVLVLHSCGMLEIAGYRLEHAVNVAFPNTYEIIYSRIAQAVRIQNRAIELHGVLWSVFGFTYFLQTVVGILSISVNLLRVYEAVTLLESTEELLNSIIFMMIHLVYMTVDQYRGQYLIQSSAGLFHKAYNAQWYITSPAAQRLFLFVMQGSMKEITFTFFGTFTVSLEGFSTITSMALSYFMVMTSMR